MATVSRSVIAKPMQMAMKPRPVRRGESADSDCIPSRRLAEGVFSPFTRSPSADSSGRIRSGRYQVFQWVIFATGGRLAGLKSVPFV